MAKVSIILTSHDRPRYLRQAMESVLNQTLKDIELIVIDDHSTAAGVGEVIQEFARKDSRVQAYRTDRNINNLSVLWNLGLDLASGEYVALLDDDNTKFPNFCERLAGFLDHNPDHPAAACFAQVWQGEQPTATFDLAARISKGNIVTDNYVDSGAMMFRRSLTDTIGWFDERLKTSEDWDYVKRIQLQTERGFGIVPELLYSYRWHDSNRMYTRVDLGDHRSRDFIVNQKNYNSVVSLLLFHQDRDKITLSQNNVLAGIEAALNSLQFLEVETLSASQLRQAEPTRIYDLVFCYAPFSLDIAEVEQIARFGQEIVHFHVEDPQALAQNQARAGYATYIFANDVAVIKDYELMVGKGKCGFCPSISLDDINLKRNQRKGKNRGIMFFGHGYESRRKFVEQLKPKLNQMGYPLSLIGGGWEDRHWKGLGELSQADSFRLMGDSEIVILKNREHRDLGGLPDAIRPQSVTRGYLECGSGALVMLDNGRPHHSFDGEVVFYDDLNNLVEKLEYYLKHDKERKRIARLAQERAWREFTYRARLRKAINAVRSMRFFVEIK